MEQALERDGRIAIYGIYFDFDEAELKPESQPQIDQLGTLLKDNPKLQVLIVGHTDGKGAFDYNLALSQRRAQAVAEALAAKYGIESARLTPAGAGMVAPVASNRTEEGRAKNRRVEIVERYTGG
jgi:outer membrane protein OmpA-like peptidoglycan-associated protein